MLIIGGDSSIGQALRADLVRRCQPCWTTTRQRERCNATALYCDLAGDISSFVPPVGQYAVLCAANSNMQHCEANRLMTWNINVTQTLKLAKICIDAGYTCVALSTNQVFDGTQFLPSALCSPNPQTEYGRQKLALEQGLLRMQPKALVIRISKVLPPVYPLFQQWLKAWQQGRTVTPFSDVWVAPLTLEQLSASVLCLVQHACHGIWHISPHEEWTYARVAAYLAEAWGVDAELVQARAAGASLAPVFRPRHVALESSATWHARALHPPTVTEALRAIATV